jgi:hypothetical protein
MDEEYNLEKFLESGIPNKKISNVTKRIIEESSRQLIDPIKLKYDKIWNEWGNKVIGAEY